MDKKKDRSPTCLVFLAIYLLSPKLNLEELHNLKFLIPLKYACYLLEFNLFYSEI